MLLPKIPTPGIEIRTEERGWASSILSTSIPIAFLCCSVSLREPASSVEQSRRPRTQGLLRSETRVLVRIGVMIAASKKLDTEVCEQNCSVLPKSSPVANPQVLKSAPSGSEPREGHRFTHFRTKEVQAIRCMIGTDPLRMLTRVYGLRAIMRTVPITAPHVNATAWVHVMWPRPGSTGSITPAKSTGRAAGWGIRAYGSTVRIIAGSR